MAKAALHHANGNGNGAGLVGLLRTYGQTGSIVLTMLGVVWQGSGWFSGVNAQLAEINRTLQQQTKLIEEKAVAKDVDYRFDLMCVSGVKQACKPGVAPEPRILKAQPKQQKGILPWQN